MVRKAENKDLNYIIQLNNELFELESGNFDEETLISTWALSEESIEYFKELIKNGFTYIYEKDSEIVAYLSGSIEKVSYEKQKYGEINNMFVKDKMRGAGIGRKLINEFLKDMKKENIADVRVTASFKNENAKKFYEKIGFHEFEINYRMEI